MSSTSELSSARYGKENIRVFRVVREGEWHQVVEYNVTVLLEGNIDISYTQADNSVIVATDSIKNITYYLAKVSPHVLIPERFALHIGTHIVSKYSHIHKAFVTVAQLRWARIPISSPTGGNEGHQHSFYRDGEDKRVIKAEIDGSAGKNKIIGSVTAGISDLLVLKTTGSAFASFIRDAYTTLAETPDRILSTSIDLEYTFRAIQILAPSDDAKLEFKAGEGEGSVWDISVPEKARQLTLEVFAKDESASVQATLYTMASQLVAAHAYIDRVTYTLPNKHYVPVDMRYIGIENIIPPSQAEVFMPIAAPSGLISATITRKV